MFKSTHAYVIQITFHVAFNASYYDMLESTHRNHHVYIDKTSKTSTVIFGNCISKATVGYPNRNNRRELNLMAGIIYLQCVLHIL